MTLPDERYRALRRVPEALYKLCEPGEKLTKANVRQTVRWVLRHYPTGYDIDRMAKKCPELLKP